MQIYLFPINTLHIWKKTWKTMGHLEAGGTPLWNPKIYFRSILFLNWLTFCSVNYTQLGPLLIFSNSAAMLRADPRWKTGGSELPGPQKHKKKNHTGSSNWRDVLSGFERHRKLEDLVRPLHGDRADILETPIHLEGGMVTGGGRGAGVGCGEEGSGLQGASAEVPPPSDLWAGTHHGVHSQILLLRVTFCSTP